MRNVTIALIMLVSLCAYPEPREVQVWFSSEDMKQALTQDAPIAVASTAKAARDTMPRLIIEEGFESGTLPFRASGNRPEVIADREARAGRYVMKSELNEGGKDPMRTEVEITSQGRTVNLDVGKEYWVGVSIKLDRDFDDDTDLNDQGMILQWHYRDWLHRDVPDAQPLVLRYQAKKIHVHNEVLQQYMASEPPACGEWVDWVFHLKLDNKDGLIQVWRNGRQVVDWKGDNHQAEKVEGAYLKLGLYSWQYKSEPPGVPFRRIVYHDELRVAEADGNYELVAPRGERKTVEENVP